MAYDLSCWWDVKTQTHTEETGGGGRKPESLICPLSESIIATGSYKINLMVRLLCA